MNRNEEHPHEQPENSLYYGAPRLVFSLSSGP